MAEEGSEYQRVPEAITPKVLELCTKIGSRFRPGFVSISAEPDCEPADCFANVSRKVNRDGGSIRVGWAIWEWPGVFIEGEHHAIYEPPAGSCIDITPSSRGITKRLFLRDDKATYDFQNEGVRRDNVRLALADDSLIEELFKAARKLNDFYNELPGVGIISIHASEDRELQKLKRRVARATAALTEKYGAAE